MKALTTLSFVVALVCTSIEVHSQLQVAVYFGWQDSMICQGGTSHLRAFASGGSAPYTYQWSPASSLSNPNDDSTAAYPTTTTTYQLTVTDALNNTVTAQKTITVLPDVNLQLTPTSTTANYYITDQVSASFNTGASPWYLINWSVDGINLGVFANYILYNYPGNFQCIVSTDYGCSDTALIAIAGGLNAAITNFHNPSCYQSSDGFIDVQVTGGNGNYIYEWDNGSTTQNLSNLSFGLYSLTVHDSNGEVGLVAKQLIAPYPVIATPIYTFDGIFPDTAVLNVSYGTPPYSFLWDNGSTINERIFNQSEEYSCTVTDNNGCVTIASSTFGMIAFDDHFTVAKDIPINLAVLANDSFDHHFISVISSLGSPSHGVVVVNPNQAISYLPNNNYIGFDTFSYVACIDTSVFSYCDTAIIFLEIKDSLILTPFLRHASCHDTCDGVFGVSVSGSTPPYTFVWSNAANNQDSINFLCAGSYSVTVTDAQNNTASSMAIINSQREVFMTDVLYSNPAIVTANLFTGGDSTAWQFNWSTGFIDFDFSQSSISVTQSGIYCVTASNAHCILEACDTTACIDCVYPGDANSDGIVDNNDLLPIGIAYGSNGPQRPNASIYWYGQSCNNWLDTLVGGVNYKHVDGDGNGVVNALDTIPIMNNFGYTHIRRGMDEWRMNLPSLLPHIIEDTVVDGDTITIHLEFGDVNNPATNIYGLAFTLNYDANVVDTAKTSSIFGNSWLGNATDKISIAKDLTLSGELKCALTRIDHTTRNGFGEIGQVSFVITTDNINGKNLAYHNMNVWINDLTVIDNAGNIMQANSGSDSVKVEFEPTAIREIQITADDVQLFPNPANEKVRIESKFQIEQVSISNVLGETLAQLEMNSRSAWFDTRQLQSGVYLVQLKTAKGTLTKKLIVAR